MVFIAPPPKLGAAELQARVDFPKQVEAAATAVAIESVRAVEEQPPARVEPTAAVFAESHPSIDADSVRSSFRAVAAETTARIEPIARTLRVAADRLRPIFARRGEPVAAGTGDTGAAASDASSTRGEGDAPSGAPAATVPTPAVVPAPTPAPLGETRAPRPLAANRAPDYPEPLRRARIEGTAWIHAVIEADGRVSGASVARSSGSDALDEAALAAVRTWRFEPALENGSAVQSEADLPIVFRLRRG